MKKERDAEIREEELNLGGGKIFNKLYSIFKSVYNEKSYVYM